MVSEGRLNLEANCLGAKVFTKQMGTERLMFLQPSKEAHDVTASPEEDESTLQTKESGLEEVSVKRTVKDESKGVEIGTK